MLFIYINTIIILVIIITHYYQYSIEMIIYLLYIVG